MSILTRDECRLIMWALDHMDGEPVSGIDADPVKLESKILAAWNAAPGRDPDDAIYRSTTGGTDGPMPKVDVPEGFERIEKSSSLLASKVVIRDFDAERERANDPQLDAADEIAAMPHGGARSRASVFGEQTPPAYKPGGALYKALASKGGDLRVELADFIRGSYPHEDGCNCSADGAYSL